MQRSTVMEFYINVCLFLLENAFWMAKHLPRRDAGDRGGPAKAKIPLTMRKLRLGTFPIFSEDKKPIELVEKGWPYLKIR